MTNNTLKWCLHWQLHALNYCQNMGSPFKMWNYDSAKSNMGTSGKLIALAFFKNEYFAAILYRHRVSPEVNFFHFLVKTRFQNGCILSVFIHFCQSFQCMYILYFAYFFLSIKQHKITSVTLGNLNHTCLYNIYWRTVNRFQDILLNEETNLLNQVEYSPYYSCPWYLKARAANLS